MSLRSSLSSMMSHTPRTCSTPGARSLGLQKVLQGKAGTRGEPSAQRADAKNDAIVQCTEATALWMASCPWTPEIPCGSLELGTAIHGKVKVKANQACGVM